MSDEPAGDGDQESGNRREPAWTRLIAPLRSEDAAFRMVVWAAGIALILAAVVVLLRVVS